ncbi:hypothetical protein H632_c50p1 [Helicosporidium sp. ATCC 50920]|nr:hypothetical protein H632_c50p1 [Helicosporidium sp. ATCC 50920]|eukprot:KDD76976.1 hypothetical protein H632_c50p1 [Helicosporidium sp. ATCC 50920]
MPPPTKQAKLSHAASEPSANVIIQFQSAEGESAGPQLDVPQGTTPEQLETLLNKLLRAADPEADLQPYSFFVDGAELDRSLGEHLRASERSVETLLHVVFRPQALFRVRPVARCSSSLAGHTEAVLALAFSPDGRRLASGSGDTSVRFWDLQTQTPRTTGAGHRGWVLALAWSPDGRFLASGDRAGAVLVWDGEASQPRGQCVGHRGFVSSLAWEPAHLALPSRRFCSGSKDGTVRVWDAGTRACLFAMSSHTQGVTAVLWGGEGLIYSAARDALINVWRAEDGSMVHSLKAHGHWVNAMSLSTSYALRTGAFDHQGSAPPGEKEARAAALERYTAALGGQAERLVTGSDDFTLCLWDPKASNKPLARMTGHMQLVNQVLFSPDGRWIASASFDKSIKIWDGLKGTFVATLRGHVGAVYQAAWSADSRLLVSGSKDSTLKVWEMRTKKLLADLPGHADEVYTVDWSPDGASVASGGKDRVLKLWRQ